MSTIYRVLAKGNPLSFLLQCPLYSLLLYNTILFDFYNTSNKRNYSQQFGYTYHLSYALFDQNQLFSYV